jgi:hypothetical protein
VVSNAIANGVDVITHSLTWFNTGWSDDSGPACDAANQASNAGIVFCTSAGNYAFEHWQGNFNAGAGDPAWHDWATGDEAMTMTVPPSTTQAATFDLQWNTAGGTFDYDLYLYNATTDALLASSTNGGNTFESLAWMNTSGSAVTVYLAVRRFSGGVTEFELFGDDDATGWEYTVAAGSTTSPSNATGANVLSVGAVPWNQYTQASGTNPIANYSSQGPSNSGMQLPDLTGPTNTTGFTYPGGFGGTSAATPNVAGALCAFWSDELPHSTNAVRWLILAQAGAPWRDWGAPGADNVYGVGPCRFVDWAANTTWVGQGYNNFSNLATGPYYTFAAGIDATVAGGRMVVCGGSYPENLTITKAMKIETPGMTATVGQ